MPLSIRHLIGVVFYLVGISMTQAFALSVSSSHPVTSTVPNSFYVDLTVADQPEPYRVFISVPETKAPKDGFPVVYLMDGNAFFSSAVNTSQALVHPRFEHKQPAIIVGLGYPIEGDRDTKRRWFDLTPPTPQPPALPKKHMERFKNMQFGGAEQALSLLVDDIRPWLAQQYPINLDQQILFGHSLGGLFTLYALHTRPEAFQGYAAISPSLWWNEGYLKPMLQQQAKEPRQGKQILMIMGEQEVDYMLKDARLAQQWFVEQGINSEYRILPYMNHSTVSLPALTMALESLLPANQEEQAEQTPES